MKTILFYVMLCLSLILISIIRAEAQPASFKKQTRNQTFKIVAKVDRRVELMSIVARLAGYEEYVNNYLKPYADDVDRHFAKYKEHPAILYAKKIRATNNIGFDAVMFMAVHLNEPPALIPRVKFTEQVPESRWGRKAAGEFAGLLRQFYRDADCESFFKSHADLYQTAEQRFQDLLNKVDFEWYRKFYGEVPHGTFNLYIGLLNGGGNFGPKVVHPDGKEDLYAIIGTWKVDDAGLPIYEGILPTIIHEYNHSFINSLVYAHEKELTSAGEKIFPSVEQKMKTLAYGNWKTMIVESLVRAAVIRYQFDHQEQPQTAYRAIIDERNQGFLWMSELSALLGTYENSRRSYPVFRSFFPLIAGYYDDLAKRIDYEAKRFEELSPRVANVSPFANQSQDVDPNITKLTITFDKPLNPKAGYSINQGGSGQEHNPIVKVIGFNETGTELTLEIKLKPDWEYEFILTGRAFRTTDGYPLQPYTVKFRTGNSDR